MRRVAQPGTAPPRKGEHGLATNHAASFASCSFQETTKNFPTGLLRGGRKPPSPILFPAPSTLPRASLAVIMLVSTPIVKLFRQWLKRGGWQRIRPPVDGM